MALEDFKLGEAVIPVNMDFSGVDAQIRAGGKRMTRSLRAIGDDMRLLGLRLATVFTAPIVGGFALAARESIKFESALVGVAKTVNANAEVITALGDAIQELATDELPIAATHLLEIAEVAGQLGIGVKDIVAFTRVIGELEETTNVLGREGATQLARFMTVTGTANSEARALGDSLVHLGNNFATTEAEILTFGLRLAGAASTVGIGNEAVMGFAAALSSLGLRAEAAGTAFSKLFRRVGRAVMEEGDLLLKFTAVAGEGFADLFKKSPDRAIVNLLRGIKQIRDSGGNLFEVLEGLNIREERLIASVLVSAEAWETLDDALNKSQGMEKQGALAAEAEKRHESLASQLTLVWNAFRAVSKTIGDVFARVLSQALPLVKSIGDRTMDLAEAFRAASPLMQNMLMGFLGLVAVIPTLVFGFGTLITVISLLQATAIAPLLLSMASVSITIIAIAAIIGSAVVIWVNFKDEILATTEALKGFLSQQFGSKLTTFTDNLKDDFEEATGFLKGSLATMTSLMRDWLQQASSTPAGGTGILSVLENDLKGIEDLLTDKKGLASLIAGSEVVSDVKGGIKDITDTMSVGFERWLKEMKDGAEIVLELLLPANADNKAARLAELLEGMGDLSTKTNMEIQALSESLAAMFATPDKEALKAVEKLKAEALALRLSLIPAEALNADLANLQRLHEAVGDVVDEEVLKAAYAALWAQYLEDGTFTAEELKLVFQGLNEEIALGFQEVTEDMQQKFDALNMDKFLAAWAKGTKKMREDTKAGDDTALAKNAREIEKTLARASRAFQKFAKNAKSSMVRGIAAVVGGLSRIMSITEDLPEAVGRMKDAFVKGAATIRVKMATALGVIGLVLEAVMLVTEVFGFFGDEGEEELSRVEEAAESLKEAFREAFDELKKQIIDFVRTGKFQLNDLIDTLLERMLDIALELVIFAPIMAAVGLKSVGSNKSISAPAIKSFVGGPSFGSITPSMAMAGGGGMEVIINDHRSTGNPVEVQQDGKSIVVTLTDAMSDAITGGKFDRPMRESFGIKRRGR